MSTIDGRLLNPAALRQPHEPFPVAEFTEGLALAREPWLSPRNAFRRVDNARIFRGDLEKRSGSDYFSEVAIEDPTPVAGFLLYSSLFHLYRPNPATLKAVPASCTFSHLNGAGATITAEVSSRAPEWVTDQAAIAGSGMPDPFDAWRWEVVETGTTTRLGWVYWVADHTQPTTAIVSWITHSGYVDTSVVGDGTISYWYNPEDEIVGLTRYRYQDSDFSFAADTDYLYRFDPTAGFYKQQGFDGGASLSVFTGTDEDYWWFWPMDDRLVMTNNVDPPCFWDPADPPATAIDEMPTDWTTPGTNEIDKCLMFVVFRGRGIYLNTTESGTSHPTRARYTDAGALTMDALGWVDAPYELGEMVTAQFIGERLFVGFATGWMELVATEDAIAPFEWRPFISRFGAAAKLSTIPDNERLLSRSTTTMQAVDPNGQYYLDAEIPELVQSFSAANTELCAGVRNEDQRAHWWTYVDASGTRPEHILCATYDEQGQNLAWSQYDMRFNVFSDFDSESTPTWNGLGPKTWNDYTGVTWNSARIGIAGFTQVLGGSAKGIVHKFGTSTVDFLPSGPGTIELDVESQRWTPFPGMQSHWGWLDIYADATPGSMLTLYFYRNTEAAPHLVRTVSLTASGTSDKVVRRVKVDMTGSFHRMRIFSSDDVALSISALVPWFRPAGRLREFN